jgi:hypothetical protein
MNMTPGDNRKDCCKDPANLYRRENDQEERPDLVVRRCRVCECRHFELTADPGKLGLRGSPIGA